MTPAERAAHNAAVAAENYRRENSLSAQVGRGIGFLISAGFTVIIIVIVLPLVLLAIPLLPSCSERARLGRLEADPESIKSAIEAARSRPAGAALQPSVVFASGCNVRKEPDEKSEVIGFAQAGRPYQVLETRRGWSKIEVAAGKTGWTGCRP